MDVKYVATKQGLNHSYFRLSLSEECYYVLIKSISSDVGIYSVFDKKTNGFVAEMDFRKEHLVTLPTEELDIYGLLEEMK